MSSTLPIEDLLAAGSPEGTCGRLDTVNEAQVDALFESVRACRERNFDSLGQAAEGLFLGGEVPDFLGATRSKDDTNPGLDLPPKRVAVKPIKHLKAAMVLILTATEQNGIRGFSDGLALLDGLLSNHWERVYPAADAEELDDPYYKRVTILNPLCTDSASDALQSGSVTTTDSWRIGERLFKAPLLIPDRSDRHAALSFRDALSPSAASLQFSLPPGGNITAESLHEVRLASATMIPEHRKAIQSAVAALEHIEEIFKIAPGGIKPKFTYLIRLLRAALAVLDSPKTTNGTEPAPGGSTGLSSGTRPVAPPSPRDEAIRKLAEVAEYFRRHEPSSPIPLLLDRVKGMASMNFMVLLEELKLGEQAVPEFRKLAGIPEKKPDQPVAKA